MKLFNHGIFLLLVLFLGGYVNAGWEPTFVDNFSANALKENAWAYGRPNLSRRSHYYDSDAVQVKNGKLEIKAINQPESDRPYLSGALTTQGIFSQKYGYFEIRAKIPKGDGFWPAFWMMPVSGKWTSEIDISEFFGDKPGSVWYAFHHSSKLRNENSYLAPTFQDLSTSFNTYAVNWTPDRIDYLFNGTVMHSITDPGAIAKADTPMYLILNLALATQHTGFVTNIDKNTDLTSPFAIDYVRVYKQSPGGQYATIPVASDAVEDRFPQAYDNTAVSIDRIKVPGETEIMRSPGKISGKFKITSNASDIKTNVYIVLNKLGKYVQHDGRYYNAGPPLQTISERNVTFNKVGDSRVISYSFDPVINTVGAYSVDVMIKDPVTQHKKSLDGHRIVQYVDNAFPESTMFFDGFVESVKADYSNNQVSVSSRIQLQQALLTPYINVRFNIVDAHTGATVKTKSIRYKHNFVGRITVDANIAATLDINGAYNVLVDVSDSSKNERFDQYVQHISGTNGTVVAPPTVEPLKNWVPTFVDNFNGNALQQEKWVVGRQNLSRRLSYYDKDAIEVANGKLHMKMLNNKPESDRPYITGAITSQGLFKQKYGYFEIRAKLPRGNGFWPAFWLLPESGKWESEIDISEFIGNKPDTVHYAYHYGGRLRNENTGQAHTLQDLSTAFNTFAVEWSPERINYLFNGKVMHSVDDKDVVANADSDMFMILNFALASQHTRFIANVDETTDLSAQFEIDYVRVFKEVPSGGFLGVPDAATAIPDIGGKAYDNTAISIDRIKAANDRDIMRSAGKIKGAIRATSHAASAKSQLLISLFKLENVNTHDGRYFTSPVIQTISRNIEFNQVGETLDISYEFDKLINSTGAYMVSVLIKDSTTLNKNLLEGHRIVQFVEESKPASTLFFEGFVRNGSAGYSNGKVVASLKLQLQQSLLVPYMNVRYQVVDNASGAVVKVRNVRVKHDVVGQLSLSQTINVNLDKQKSYSVVVDVVDSSGKFSIDTATIPVGGASGVTNPPPVSGEYALHSLTVKTSGADLTAALDITLPDGASISSLNYITKLYSLQDNSLKAKLSGTLRTDFLNGRQAIVVTHDNAANLGNEKYRAVVFLFKDDWNDSNKVIYQTLITSN
ncbi:MAG: glycoside hydrolase family 16 protein [Gammaproteobacteria bacterium]